MNHTASVGTLTNTYPTHTQKSFTESQKKLILATIILGLYNIGTCTALALLKVNKLRWKISIGINVGISLLLVSTIAVYYQQRALPSLSQQLPIATQTSHRKVNKGNLQNKNPSLAKAQVEALNELCPQQKPLQQVNLLKISADCFTKIAEYSSWSIARICKEALAIIRAKRTNFVLENFDVQEMKYLSKYRNIRKLQFLDFTDLRTPHKGLDNCLYQNFTQHFLQLTTLNSLAILDDYCLADTSLISYFPLSLTELVLAFWKYSESCFQRIKNMSSLTTLSMNNLIEDPSSFIFTLKHGDLPESLRSFEFHIKISISGKALEVLKQHALTYLSLAANTYFPDDVIAPHFSPSLTSLKLVNIPISAQLNELKELQKLSLTNPKIPQLPSLPVSLMKLSLYLYDFAPSLRFTNCESLSTLTKLQELKLNGRSNVGVDQIELKVLTFLPPSLTSLYLGFCYQYPIDNKYCAPLQNLTRLNDLEIGSLHISIPFDFLPISLTSLLINKSNAKNQDLIPLTQLTQLQVLKFDGSGFQETTDLKRFLAKDMGFIKKIGIESATFKIILEKESESRSDHPENLIIFEQNSFET